MDYVHRFLKSCFPLESSWSSLSPYLLIKYYLIGIGGKMSICTFIDKPSPPK